MDLKSPEQDLSLRLPHFQTIGTGRWYVSPNHRLALLLENIHGTRFS